MIPSYSTNDPRGWCGDPKRGAALGRLCGYGSPDYAGVLYIRHVPLIGDYDVNGTYFGSGEPLWWVASEDGTVDYMERGKSRAAVEASVRTAYPSATVKPYPKRSRGEASKAELIASMDEFAQAYVTCALWSTFDEPHDVYDVTRVCLARMIRDCEAFQAANRDLLQGLDAAQCGHDLWLSRNGHGVGFDDRGNGAVGEALQKVARMMGEVDLTVYRGKIS